MLPITEKNTFVKSLTKAAGVPCIHYYTMTNSAEVKKIASELF